MGRWDEARELAVERFADASPLKVNCAQAVVAFAAHGLDKDPRSIMLARYFGGGGVRMGQLCGAVSGMLLAMGMHDYYAQAEEAAPSPELTTAFQKLLGDFEAEFGSVTCRVLTGHDIRTKEGYVDFKADPVSKKCADYVAWACDRLRPLLEAAG